MKQAKRNYAIRQMRKRGVTCAKIGHRFGISQQRVWQLCNQSEVQSTRRWPANGWTCLSIYPFLASPPHLQNCAPWNHARYRYTRMFRYYPDMETPLDRAVRAVQEEVSIKQYLGSDDYSGVIDALLFYIQTGDTGARVS